MILHNLCTIRKDDAVDFTSGADEEWQEFFKQYPRDACPSCVRRNTFHCPHISRFRNAQPSRGSSASELRDAIKEALWEDMRSNEEDVNAVVADMAARAAGAEI